MAESVVGAVLDGLRKAADALWTGWLPEEWRKVSGPGPDTLQMVGVKVVHPYGSFAGLKLEPGAELALATNLAPPKVINGVDIDGDRLELTVNSLFPVDVLLDGNLLFGEDLPVVAAGPVALPLVDQLQAGESNGELTYRIRPPKNQLMSAWNWLHFTTPRLHERFELVDTAWAQLYLAANLAATPEQREVVEKAAYLVPDELTTDGVTSGSLESAFGDMATALAPLADTIAERRVHIIGHSHIDMNWLWTMSDTVEVVKRDFRSVLELMDDYPDMTFTHSQPATYRMIQEHEPELFAKVTQRIAEGRWEPATMTWVENDTNMSSGEGMCHQLLEAVRFTRDELGYEPVAFMAPDTFGHAGNLPQLAVSAGSRLYYHHRSNPGKMADGDIWPAYWWEGDDGTRLLVLSTRTYNGFITAGDIARATVELGARRGLRSALHFHGVGDHGGGPTRRCLDTLGRLQRTPLMPTVAPSTLSAFAKDILDSGAPLPTRIGESTTVFEGCYTTHADTKRYNRHGENLLSTADTLAAVAGIDRTTELSEAWRRVCFNQFHDILDGSAIHEAYDDHARDFEAASATAHDVTSAALGVLEADAGAPAGVLTVTNPLGLDRADSVLVRERIGDPSTGVWVTPLGADGEPDGGEVPAQYTSEGLVFVARVPAFGTVSYAVREDPNTPAARAVAVTDAHSGGFTGGPCLRVETDAFRLLIRKDSGIITGLFDKRVGRELCGTQRSDTSRHDLAFNVLQILDEVPHGMTSWIVGEVATETQLLRGAEVSVVEQGPLRTVVQVRHTVRSSVIDQRIVCWRGLPRIDFVTDIDWHEPNGPEVGVPTLKAAFTGWLPGAQPWFESPFGAVTRADDGQETPALRWAAIDNGDHGFAVVNESKYGHDAMGNRLRLTLVRNAYDPDAVSDAGHHRLAYSLVPYAGDWRSADVARTAIGFNQPLLARPATPDTVATTTVWRPQIIGSPNVVVSTLKVANDAGGPAPRVIRLYECAGRPGTAEVAAIPAGAQVSELSVTEDHVGPVDVANGRLHLAFRPHQVRTVCVELA